MKLVNILAREFTEWPGKKVLAISQAMGGELTHEYRIPTSEDEKHWKHCGVFTQLASDWINGVVTKSQWESARAAYLLTQQTVQDPSLSKIGKSMAKANKDGWIRHRGGKRPVHGGLLVEVRLREGSMCTREAGSFDWSHIDQKPEDVMAWRLAKTEAKEVEDSMAKIGQAISETTEEGEARFSGEKEAPKDPVSLRQQWESLGHEIKSNECSIKAHQEAIAGIIERQKAIEAELKAAGFLIYAEAEPVKVDASEDMSDPKNWRVGDVFISDAGYSFDGKQVRLRDICESDHTFECEPLDGPGFGYWFIEDGLKFHSRP